MYRLSMARDSASVGTPMMDELLHLLSEIPVLSVALVCILKPLS